MSPNDYKSDRMDLTEARKTVTVILTSHPGGVRFSGHAITELAHDGLTTDDALNVLKSPCGRIVKQPDFKNGSWRYVVETSKVAVCVAFDSATALAVVTAWRKGN